MLTEKPSIGRVISDTLSAMVDSFRQADATGKHYKKSLLSF